MKKPITGMMIYYKNVCERKLWYYYHSIEMEHTNENVQIGKLVDETTYMRDEKHISIDNVISIDFIREHRILHEVKKSRSIEEASVWQLKYYLYYLKRKGVDNIKGKIDYPLLRESVVVELTDNDCSEIEGMIAEIYNVVNKLVPPKIEGKKICKNCAFYDLCYI